MAEPTMMKAEAVAVSDVVELQRLRPVSEAGVASLIASVTELGVMKDPIHVRKRKDGQLVLMAGSHRLEMARRLGWDQIPARVWTDVTDDWARMMEIDDNLAGAEMNALDTAVFLATRKEVYERIHPETSAGIFKGNQHTGKLVADMMSVSSFAAVTAEKFGLTDRHVRRMIAAGSKLHPDEVRRLRAAPKQVSLADLQAIAKVQQATERYHVVDALEHGTAKNAAAARAAWLAKERGHQPVIKDPVEEAFIALSKAWERAPKAARDRFAADYRDDLIAVLSSESMRVAAE